MLWFFPEDGAMMLVFDSGDRLGQAILVKRARRRSAFWRMREFLPRSASRAAMTHQTGTKAPDTVMVNNQRFSLQHGEYAVFFFDHDCSHCNARLQDHGHLQMEEPDVQ